MILELMEKAEKCETDEGRLALLAENGIELIEGQLEKWVKTKNKRSGW